MKLMSMGAASKDEENVENHEELNQGLYIYNKVGTLTFLLFALGISLPFAELKIWGQYQYIYGYEIFYMPFLVLSFLGAGFCALGFVKFYAKFVGLVIIAYFYYFIIQLSYNLNLYRQQSDIDHTPIGQADPLAMLLYSADVSMNVGVVVVGVALLLMHYFLLTTYCANEKHEQSADLLKEVIKEELFTRKN